MPIDNNLLEILCCPVTKVPVQKLSPPKLATLNQRIQSGNVRNVAGSVVTEVLEEALVTENGTTIYRVQSGIPVMLEDEGITTAPLGDL
jgi:uncharacterized protein YbaR (Trm112 family)